VAARADIFEDAAIVQDRLKRDKSGVNGIELIVPRTPEKMRKLVHQEWLEPERIIASKGRLDKRLRPSHGCNVETA